MPDADIADLLARSQFVFEATVDGHQRSTVPDVPVDDHTVVVRVDRVLQSPAALANTAGSEVTVQLLPGTTVPAEGARAVLFTSAVAFGRGIAVAEVGRVAPDEVGPATMAAGAPATIPGARPGRAHPVLEAAQQLDDARLQAHAAAADAVVVGRVVGVEKVGPPPTSEHDPDLWRATIEVEQTEKGDVAGRVQVLYPNSADVQWARIPKPRPGQDGLWLLHATPEEDAELGRFSLVDTDDAHPAEDLGRLRPDDA